MESKADKMESTAVSLWPSKAEVRESLIKEN